MKKLLTFTALLFNLTGFGQNGKFKIYESTAKNYFKGNYMTLGGSPIEFKYANDSISVSNFSWMVIMPLLGSKTKYYQIDIPEVLSVSGNVDTLEIKSKDIKFIKVDGEIYYIKRTTELKEVEQPTNFGFKGRIDFAQPHMIYNDGYAISARSIVPRVDTVSWYGAKHIDTLTMYKAEGLQKTRQKKLVGRKTFNY